MESKSRAKPLLPFYFFKQSFDCDENWDEVQQKFIEYVEKAKEKSWFEFWETQGNEIILKAWKNKYKDYINETNCEVEKEKTQDDIKSEDLKEEFVQIEDDQDAQGWQALWKEHINVIYAEQYNKFESIYDNYYWSMKEAFQADNEINNQAKETYEQIESELEQLRLAGLPTAFGSSQKSNPKKRERTISIESSEESEYLSDFDYSEDSLSETEMSSAEKNEDLTKILDKEPERTESIDNLLHKTLNNTIDKRKSKKNRHMRKIPTFMLEDKSMLKYWRQRFSLFSRFDEGIQLDRESWFSVTPEKVARHMAQRLACDIIVDGFCGSGGNSIQFAMTCNKVIAIDIDPIKVEMARHNAEIYGVADKIEFIVGDFLELSAKGNLKANNVFLSPPWGGPSYTKQSKYDIETQLEPIGAKTLVALARNISDNIALFLPRNSNVKQIVQLAGVGNTCEIEHNYLDTRVVGLTALYGDCIKK